VPPAVGRIPLIADGASSDGAIIEALLFGGDTVMLGNAFAGTLETPGEIVHKSVVLPESQKVVRVPFKVFRGMASIGAMVDRLDVEDADTVDVDTLGAEGLEVSVPLRGSARPIIAGMLKHLSSSISYGGAASLAELKTIFWERPEDYIIKLSESSKRESFER
jgi:IMP dehydrogenase